MTETVVLPEDQAAVRDYVVQVRAALSDLPPEDADDLTGGLEADLAERAAELPPGTNLALAFGAPQTYAAELRSAAGLPEAVPPAPTPRASFLQTLDAFWHNMFTRSVERWPWVNDLRPVWWLLRGFVLGWAAMAFLHTAGATRLLAGVVLAVASFMWGRRTLPASRWVHRMALVANALALVCLLPVASQVLGPRVVYVDTPVQDAGPVQSMGAAGIRGVWVNGEAASNLYVYDAAGNRIDNVRLFNQYGQAVTVSPDVWFSLDPKEQPPLRADGSFDVNDAVFPVRWGNLSGWGPSTGGWEPPVKISDLATRQGAGASASPSASPTASAGPAESASPAASSTP